MVHKHNKLEQKRCQNDVKLWKNGCSKSNICLIQREVISKIKGFGLQCRSFEIGFLKRLAVFSSSYVHGYHLT